MSADFSCNLVKTLSCDGSWDSLLALSLAENRLKSCRGLRELHNLRHLDISFNIFHDLDSALPALPRLESLDLSGNELQIAPGFRLCDKFPRLQRIEGRCSHLHQHHWVNLELMMALGV